MFTKNVNREKILKHESWFNCGNKKEVEKFQTTALIKLRDTESKFQRGTESDKIVLMALEIAKEILLNVKYEG
jgi:hypothetical protein